MSNKALYNNKYIVPNNILEYIRSIILTYKPNNGQREMADHILTYGNNGGISHQYMEKLKHLFTHNKFKDNIEYTLAGGDLMKGFVETELNQVRSGVERSKEVRRDMTSNPNSELKPYQTPRLNEEKKELAKNALAVIVNEDNKFLLLKRGEEAPWMPEKWSLVGGGIEKGETPQKAIEREILEETSLKIKEFIKTFSIQRNPDSIEHIFACRYDGDPTDISLDDSENTNYGWYDINEMEYLDVVPNLIEYITLAFSGKKYD
jgi:8-oxo-dGTP pyrophosphatase MutT (NUDIX family)